MATKAGRPDELNLRPGPPAEILTPFGPLSPAAFARLFPSPSVLVVEARPLDFILSFLGYSIDDVVSSRQARAWVRILWRIFKESRRLGAESVAERNLALELWWRELGCPVPCPICGVEEACGCARKQPRTFWNRKRREVPLCGYSPCDL